MLSSLTDSGASASEVSEVPFSMNMVATLVVEDVGDTGDNEGNAEREGFVPVDVLLNMLFEEPMNVLSDESFVVLLIVLLFVLTRSTLRAWKTMALSRKRSKSQQVTKRVTQW
jgi:hypothetical protein